MGSGHILVYAFDVFMDIYRMQGYTDREAVRSILENNLYGLEIDDRATQLAYFSIMMKARSYDRRFLTRKDENGKPDIPKLNICSIQESNAFVGKSRFITSNADVQKILDYVFETFVDAKEYGSILNVEAHDYNSALQALDEFESDYEITYDNLKLVKQIPIMRNLVMQAKLLSQKYDVVCTNPPYMGGSGMDNDLSTYVKKNYPDSKADLFAVFIEKCGQMTKKNGYQAMITQQSWMFLSSFEKLRKKLLLSDTVNMVHLGARAFDEIGGEVVQTTSFVIRKSHTENYNGTYCRLIEPKTQNGKEDMFLSRENRYIAQQENFSKIPGSPIAYWVSGNLLRCFSEFSKVADLYKPASGTSTGDNDKYLKLWQEVSLQKIDFNAKPNQISNKKWFPCNKGGAFRKWSGGNEYLIDWENDGLRIKNEPKAYLRNISRIYHQGITWSKLGSGAISFRLFPQGYICESIGCALFANEHSLIPILGLANSKIAAMILGIINPTLGRQPGYIGSIPYYIPETKKDKINLIVIQNITLSKADWDSYETSWDFKIHPLVAMKLAGAYAWGDDKPTMRLSSAYNAWKILCEGRFNKLKANEEELNRIFIDIYGLQDELTPDVADKDITVHRVFDSKDDVPESMKGSNYIRTKRDEIVSFISYAVGCMFGRYSLDVEGLAYAGGEWDDSKYTAFAADKDNIIPISDDEYFEDDVVGRFVKFVETVYGSETLQENLKFIADALGGKGQPKEVIRSYFLNEFYKDHCKIYQKRPIYWLFDSGKKNGFKCLIYMHRYHPDTIARIRTDYVHEQQARYHTAIADLENRIANASTGERVKLDKQLKTLNDQATEIHEYEEKIHHLADRMISIDLDDGVKVNYAKFQDVLAKIK